MAITLILGKSQTECIVLDNDLYHAYLNQGKNVFERVKFYERDEFYAYEDELRKYLGEELYPDYLKY